MWGTSVHIKMGEGGMPRERERAFQAAPHGKCTTIESMFFFGFNAIFHLRDVFAGIRKLTCLKVRGQLLQRLLFHAFTTSETVRGCAKVYGVPAGV